MIRDIRPQPLRQFATAAREKLYFDSVSYFQELFADIENAKTSIEIEAYILSDDAIGRTLCERLIRARERGVFTRLIVDGFGSAFFAGDLLLRMEKGGVLIRVYHPMPWHYWHWPYEPKAKTSKTAFPNPWILRFFAAVNRRNHRKLVIIDNKIAWLGSLNFSQDHLPREEGGEGWVDLGLRWDFSHGQNRLPLNTGFNQVWDHERRHFPASDLPILENLTNKTRRMHYKELLKNISDSKERIWIVNAYFVPPRSLMNRLKKAARRGVEVKILVPAKSDVWFVPFATAVFYENLLKFGIQIYEYSESFIHAKAILLDNIAIVGSTNLNHRSLRHDLEADAVIQRPTSIQLLEAWYTNLIGEARLLTPHSTRTLKRWIAKLIGHIILIFRYFI